MFTLTTSVMPTSSLPKSFLSVRLLRRLPLLLVGVMGLMGLTACSSGPSVEDYKDESPRFVLEEFFDGPVTAWGMVQGRNGEVKRRFVVDIVGTWEGDQGTLHEDFRYLDGETDTRIWRIQKQADGRYIGKADDILGEATGVSSGNALRWRYDMRLAVGDDEYEVGFDDWMFLVDENSLMNRSVITKFGMRVAEVVIFMRKGAGASDPEVSK